MHPVIRLALLFVLAAALPALSLGFLALLALGLPAAHLVTGGVASLRQLAYGTWRLRWLFLAILFLYVGMTRGAPLTDALPGLSREGLLEAVRRALVLFDLLAAVYLLALLTPVESTVAGLLWLLRPARRIGLDPERLAMRIGLVLAHVRAADHRVAGAQRTTPESLFGEVARRISSAESVSPASSPAPRVPHVEGPTPMQWLIPVAVGLAIYGVPL